MTAFNRSSDTYNGYGYITVSTVVAPEKTEETARAILGVASDLSTGGGVTDEELERAKNPALMAIRDWSGPTSIGWMESFRAARNIPCGSIGRGRARLTWSR